MACPVWCVLPVSDLNSRLGRPIPLSDSHQFTYSTCDILPTPLTCNDGVDRTSTFYIDNDVLMYKRTPHIVDRFELLFKHGLNLHVFFPLNVIQVEMLCLNLQKNTPCTSPCVCLALILSHTHKNIHKDNTFFSSVLSFLWMESVHLWLTAKGVSGLSTEKVQQFLVLWARQLVVCICPCHFCQKKKRRSLVPFCQLPPGGNVTCI